MSPRKPLSLAGDPYSKIVSEVVGRVRKIIEEHPASAKIVDTALEDAMSTLYADQSMRRLEYLRGRMDQAVERYISIGLHDYAGFMESDFRAQFKPLIEKTLDTFRDLPADRALRVRKGEFSVLVVLPSAWVPLRRLLMCVSKLGGKTGLTADFSKELLDAAKIADVAGDTRESKSPSVLVGLSGGRDLKDIAYGKAAEEVKKFGLTYLSASEYAQLLLVRPGFLSSGSAVALGGNIGGKYLHVATTCNELQACGMPTFDLIGKPDERSGAGVGKPYFSKMITT